MIILSGRLFLMVILLFQQGLLMVLFSLLLLLLLNKDAKTLMEAIEKRFGGNKETKKVQKTLLKQQYENFTGSNSESLDQIHDRLQKLISQLEILGESLSQEDINLNTNESVSDDASVSAASAKVPFSALPNQIDADDLEEIDLKWQMAMLTMRAKSVKVLEAMIGAFRQKKNQPTMPSWHSPPQVLPVLIMRKSQFDVISYKTGLKSVEARILIYQQNETVFEEDIKLLKLDIRDNALVDLRKKFKKAEQERDELKLKIDKFHTSSKNLSQLLASQTNDKTGLGYDNQVFNSSVFDCDEMFSFDSDPNLVFHDAPTVNETVPTAFNVELSPTKRDKDLSQSNRPSALLIEDWVFDSEDEFEGKFNGKADEGFLVRYSVSRSGPTWLFNIDTLTKSMNYQPVTAGKQPNPSVGIQEHFDADKAGEEPESEVHVSPSSSPKAKKHDDKTKRETKGKIPAVGKISTNNTNTFSAAGPSNTDPALENITYFDDEKDVGVEADFSNLETNITVSPIPSTRVHKDHHVTQIIGDLSLAPQTRSMTRMVKEQGELTQINNDEFHTCMFACFLSQKEPKSINQAHKDPSWIEDMQEELLQFNMQKMDVKSDFLYGTIKEEVYVCQPPGFEDPNYPNMVYKVVKALYGLHQAPRAWYETLAHSLLENGIQRGKIDQTLFIKKQKGDILLVQDKYVAKILRMFDLTNRKSASTPIDTEKPLLKDPDGKDVDAYTYSQENFKYLKGKPHLGLWYPKDSPFNLVAYSDINYASACLDRKSTTGGCQFLGCRLISWQFKKQTVVATSSTEAEYAAVASCCAQVLWIQNQ
nr:hypothetical protein [Tanacetum cinerariifolium]